MEATFGVLSPIERPADGLVAWKKDFGITAIGLHQDDFGIEYRVAILGHRAGLVRSAADFLAVRRPTAVAGTAVFKLRELPDVAAVSIHDVKLRTFGPS